jgi:hypothetical protein
LLSLAEIQEEASVHLDLLVLVVVLDRERRIEMGCRKSWDERVVGQEQEVGHLHIPFR